MDKRDFGLCPICKTKLVYSHVYVYFINRICHLIRCPNEKGVKHIFEFGNYKTKRTLMKKWKEYNNEIKRD